MDTAERQAKIDFILGHYENPHRYGALEDATVVQRGGNPGCGDVVTFYLKVDEGGAGGADGGRRIGEISFEGEGCTISQAGASLATELLEGKSLDEVEAMPAEVVLDLLGREITATRLRCATLGLNTAKAAVRRLRRVGAEGLTAEGPTAEDAEGR